MYYNQRMIYLVIATILFSLSFGLIKECLSTLPSEFVVFARLFIASLFFLPFVKTIKLKTNIPACLIGIIQFGVMYLCYIKAYKYLQGNEIALLTTTTPLFVGIWSMITGEKFKPIYILCILMSVIGAVIIVYKNITFHDIIRGVVLMESSNCSFALGQVLWKKYVGKENVEFVFCAYLGAAIFAMPFALFTVNFSTIDLTLVQMLSILYLALVPTGIGFWLWNKGAKFVGYSTLAVMNNLKIPLGVLFSILLFKEKVNPINFVIGSLIIFSATLILHYSQEKSTN